MKASIIATVSFGHEREDILAALLPAIELRRNHPNLQVVCIDDSSGNDPGEFNEIESVLTSTRKGFAGAVNELVDRYGSSADRLVLINPDAQIDSQTLEFLIETNEAVAVPTIRNAAGQIENVKTVTTASQQLRALLFGEKYASNPEGTPAGFLDGIISMPPACPSGAVVSIDIELLKKTPLREEFFWLELSDWVYRTSTSGYTLRLEVLKQNATHVGASTSVKYPVSVAASQLRAKKAFVYEYGSKWHRLVLPLAMASRALRFGIKTKSATNSIFIFLVGLGIRDWRVSR